MAGDGYLMVYEQFFTKFAATVVHDDQLPVKVAGYSVCDSELLGEIVDWILQYLSQKHCPTDLLTHLMKIVIGEIRQDMQRDPKSCGYRADDNSYQPLKLMQVVTAKVNDVCLRYPGRSELLATLPRPINRLCSSVCAIKNARRKMEDRHTIIEDFHSVFNVHDDVPNAVTYYGIFDGHAGTDAAVYCVSHLHQFLAESTAYPGNPVQAISEAFLRTDKYYLEKSKRESLQSGTTALCALLNRTEKMLYVAWAGDSQAALVTRGKAVQLVESHKPDREDERLRIEKAGGCVIHWGTWRVNGQLAVSRAIGDIEYKPYVTAEPDILAIPLDENQDFLVLGCDGLWDNVTEQQAAVSVYNTIRERPGDLEAVSASLVQLSKEQGSVDNISVIVVFLTDPAILAALDVWPTVDPIPAVTMDTSFETNPFQSAGEVQTNGSSEATYQKANLLLELDSAAEKYKQNAGSPTATDLFFMNRAPANGKEEASYDDEDFGPETDVDAVDDVLLSPAIAAAKAAAAAAMAFEAEMEMHDQQISSFDAVGQRREETPTPPADGVIDGELHVPEADNVGESGEESEDEWNYFRVEATEKSDKAEAKTEDHFEDKIVVEDDEDNMDTRLNPNAAEFVPSPTAIMPTMEELLLAESPRKGGLLPSPMDDVHVPSPVEFQEEVCKRPAELDLEASFNSGANDSVFNNPLPDFLNGNDEPHLGGTNPYDHPASEPLFGEFREAINPFKASDHLFDKSEVSSTHAEFGDETASSFANDLSEADPFQKASYDLNASMVEKDFQESKLFEDVEFESKNSLDFIGADMANDSEVNNTIPISMELQNEFESSATKTGFLSDPFSMQFDSQEQCNIETPLNLHLDSQVPDVSTVSPIETKSLSSPTEPANEARLEFDKPTEMATIYKEEATPSLDLPVNTNLASDTDLFGEFAALDVKVSSPSFEPVVESVESSLINGMEELQLNLNNDVITEDVQPSYSNELSPVQVEPTIPQDFSPNLYDTSIPGQAAEAESVALSENSLDYFLNDPVQMSKEIDTQPIAPELETENEPIIETETEDKLDELVETTKEALKPSEETSATPVIAATAAVAAAALVAVGAAALATEEKPNKDDSTPKVAPKKMVGDKTKPAAKPTATRAPVKAPLKSSPTKTPTSPPPMSAPRSSSTPKKPTTPVPARVASKVTSTSKLTTTTTSSVTARPRVGATAPKAATAPTTKPAPAKTTTAVASSRLRTTAPATLKPGAEKKSTLTNGDAKAPIKRPDPLATKRLVTMTATKPLVRPASAPVATKTTTTTKTSTITRTPLATAAKPAPKPAVNGVNKSKSTTATSTLITARAKPLTMKAGAVDKQVKDLANKQISQTVTSRSSTSAATRKVGGTATKTSTVKTTTTTTTNKSGPIRRPAGTTVTKTTTTNIVDGQVEKNEVVVVEEATSTVTKDESPIVDNARSMVISLED